MYVTPIHVCVVLQTVVSIKHEFMQGSRAASQDDEHVITEVSTFLAITQVSSGFHTGSFYFLGCNKCMGR